MAINTAQGNDVARYTRELIPNIVDHLAEVKPNSLYAEYPISTLSYQEGYRKFTYGDLANAVNGVAWWLSEALGPGKDFETLAYIGPNDLRYPALILGAVKAGYTMFLTSPRNSVAAQINLFGRLKCKTMLSPTPRPPPVDAILDAHELRVLEVPSVDRLLEEQYPHFPVGKTFAEALSEPLFAIHTSGSTGLPKPLVFTHDTAARNMTMMALDPPLGLDSQDEMHRGKRVFMTFPPFHGAYLACHLFDAVPFNTVMIAPPSGAIPSAEGLVEGLKKTPADIAFVVPSIIHELSQTPELLDYCTKNLEMIIYCGGDLPQAIGDVVASKIRLVNQYGASELGLTALLQSKRHRDPGDWKYVHFHPDIGAELRPVANGEHELYIFRNSKLEKQQPTFTLFPNLQEYPSRDLFVRHPSNPDLWKWIARADDITVFLNGEKTNPISMEQHITSCNPEVAAVLVAGAQRFQAALLIEPVTDVGELSLSERAAFIEKIWPTIADANEECPAHARVAQTHILFTHPQKPMLRAGKGTIRRAETLRLYANELDALYANADLMSTDFDGGVPGGPVNLEDTHAVHRFIADTISSLTNWQQFDDNDNLFTLGMDSLQALTAVRKLKQGLAMPTIALSTLYTNPSISTLTTAVLQLSKQHEVSQTSKQQVRSRARSSMLKEYQDMIDRIPMPSKTTKEPHAQNVILTGSTGALGSYILDTLLCNPAVAHVYCLNRSSDGMSLQIERNRARGLSTHFNSSRVTFLTADLSQPCLGLQPKAYGELLEVATLVIHNAWPVNFNLSLDTFRPQLAGLVNLIEFTASATMSPRIFFISSISSVLSFRNASLQTPEEVILDDSAPGPNGYAESKYISERLLDHSAQRLSINASFARVGQIGGAIKHAGLWNKAEWFPSLVISSLHVGAVPDSLGSSLNTIDWVPVDLLAEVIIELALGETNGSNQNVSNGDRAVTATPRGRARVFHPLNPQPTTWGAVRPIVTDALYASTGKQLETIPFDSWLKKVRHNIEQKVDGRNALKDDEIEAFLRVNPAVKLLDFYEEVMRTQGRPANKLEIRETERSSAKLRALEGVKAEWIWKWVREWVASLE